MSVNWEGPTQPKAEFGNSGSGGLLMVATVLFIVLIHGIAEGWIKR